MMGSKIVEGVKFKIVIIRGRKIMMLPGVRIPKVYFHPDTPKKVVWLEPS